MPPFPQPPSEAEWEHDDAGLVVRPYAVTAGRTRPATGSFDLVSVVLATGPSATLGPSYGPEQVAIVQLCQHPLSVAEISAHVDLPPSVVRVLLGDLLDAGLITVRQPPPPEQQLTEDTLEAMLDGLRAL